MQERIKEAEHNLFLKSKALRQLETWKATHVCSAPQPEVRRALRASPQAPPARSPSIPSLLNVQLPLLPSPRAGPRWRVSR